MNCATLLSSAIEELKKQGKTVKEYNLYDLHFSGCHGCFACKKEHKNSYGECIVQDELQEIFHEIDAAEGIIFAAPIYFMDVTGEMRSFFERLLFRKFVYSNPPRTIAKEPKHLGFIYTMGMQEAQFESSSLKAHLAGMERYARFIYTHAHSYYSFGTKHVNSYKDIEFTYYNPQERLDYVEEHFPQELENVKHFITDVLQ